MPSLAERLGIYIAEHPRGGVTPAKLVIPFLHLMRIARIGPILRPDNEPVFDTVPMDIIEMAVEVPFVVVYR
jgi:hypothetical protein